jgi:tetratricopeptide (TPR) repeat protein
MGRIEKTVFISYRRTNFPWALAIFQNLNSNGYDVFFDYNGIAGGDFESVILDNIRARAHFLVLLTPSALQRCGDPEDWLRREIETALETKRNIVPLMLEGFDFSTPAIANQLTDKLADLKRYQALSVPADYFMEAMERLRQKHLSVKLNAVLHPPSRAARQAAAGQQAAAEVVAAVPEKELTAQQYFERGLEAKWPDEKIRFYSQAIRLNPVHAEAFNNRGVARREKRDLAAAQQDFNEAIRLRSDYTQAFNNRGLVRHDRGDLVDALEDYNEAIRLKPDFAEAFYNRARVRRNLRDLAGALKDYTEAIHLEPEHAYAFYNRALLLEKNGDYEAAIADFQAYLDNGGGRRDGDYAEVEHKIRELRRELKDRQTKKGDPTVHARKKKQSRRTNGNEDQ